MAAEAGWSAMVFMRLMTTRLVFLDAIGSDPTKPRKIPGVRQYSSAVHRIGQKGSLQRTTALIVRWRPEADWNSRGGSDNER